MYTLLNNKQHECLDRITEKDPNARVVGWHEGQNGYGPIVRLSNNVHKFVNMTGYARRM